MECDIQHRVVQVVKIEDGGSLVSKTDCDM